MWLHRNFSNLEIEQNYSTLWRYVDLTPDGLYDDITTTKLKNLTNQLNDKVDPANRLDNQLEWNGSELISRAMEHDGYMEKVASRYKEMVMESIGRILEEKVAYDARRIKIVGKGESIQAC